MFGHWYDSPRLISAARDSLALCEDHPMRAFTPKTELAVFVDETAYKLFRQTTDRNSSAFAERAATYNIRTALGGCGIPYHLYLIDDFAEAMSLGNYKAVMLATVPDTEKLSRALSYCNENGIPAIKLTLEKYSYTPEELRRAFTEVGIHSYTDCGCDVVYVGRGILALHASEAGEKTLRLPEKMRVKALFDAGDGTLCDTVSFTAKQYETRIFEISR